MSVEEVFGFFREKEREKKKNFFLKFFLTLLHVLRYCKAGQVVAPVQ